MFWRFKQTESKGKSIRKNQRYAKSSYLNSMSDVPPQILKGSLSIIILKLLSENDAMYGYEICQHVKEITTGQMRVTEGALYPR